VNRSRDDAKARLLAELKGLTPTGFEHFCKELLQQLGFRSVVVTRRTGDGGIDGYGDFRQGAVSIKSAFQAKRWTDGAVGRPDIDKLRGAIQGDYDHGVFITRSRFTRDATEASYKKGAITILLLDGEAIAELMIERGIQFRSPYAIALRQVGGDVDLLAIRHWREEAVPPVRLLFPDDATLALQGNENTVYARVPPERVDGLVREIITACNRV